MKVRHKAKTKKARAKEDVPPFTPVIVRTREEHLVKSTKKQLSPADQMRLTADTFNSIHTRIALNDGISPNSDLSMTREKLFEIIAIEGWERTLQVLASCARLFAEVPTPLPPFPDYISKTLHKFASLVDGAALELRLVDREASKGHKI